MSLLLNKTEQTKRILGLKLYWKHPNITILIRNIENNNNIYNITRKNILKVIIFKYLYIFKPRKFRTK